MCYQQGRLFIPLLMLLFGLFSLPIYPASANDGVLYRYDGILTNDEDGLQLSNFKIMGSSPWKAGDTVTVEFDLKNITHKTISFGNHGVFAGCLDPGGKKEDFGHQFRKKALEKGKTVHFKAAKRLDKMGTWTFWPSYYLAPTTWVNHRRGYGIYKWHAVVLKPSTKPVTGSNCAKCNCGKVNSKWVKWYHGRAAPLRKSNPGGITTFREPELKNEIWRLTHDPAVRAWTNYHNIQAWSQDGRYICYTLWVDGPGEISGAEVHVIDLNSGKDMEIEKGYNPRWARRQNWLFYINRDCTYADTYTIRRCDVNDNTFDNNISIRTIAAGAQRLGEVSHKDEWLFGTLVNYTPGVEYTTFRVRTQLTAPDQLNRLEILDVPTKHPWPLLNPAHPVVEARYREGDPVLGSRAILYDLDGSNPRVGAILVEESHISWRGDGEYLLLGNMQVSGRRYNNPYPSDLVKLANNDIGDISPCDTTGRYVCGHELKIYDLRSGDTRELVRTRSGIIYPAKGDHSEWADIDPKGSPDGTKILYHSTRDLQTLLLVKITEHFDYNDNNKDHILKVKSTSAWEADGGGYFVYDNREVIRCKVWDKTSFIITERGVHSSYKHDKYEKGAFLIDYNSYKLTPDELKRAHPDPLIKSMVTDPDNNPLLYQPQTDCYIVVARRPDSPWLRFNNGKVEVIPGERHAEIHHYKLLRKGKQWPDADTFYIPGAEFTVTEKGVFEAVAIEWSGLESTPGNPLLITASTRAEVLKSIPGNFPWIYDLTENGVTHRFHRFDEGVPNRLIAREYKTKNHFIHEDLNHEGYVIRHEEYDKKGGTLLLRCYCRRDTEQEEPWCYSEEHFDPGDGYKTSYIRYNGPDQGHSEYEHWEYDDARPLSKEKDDNSGFDYTHLLFTQVNPPGGGTVVSVPNQAGFGDKEQVTLRAQSNPGYSFLHWAGDVRDRKEKITTTLMTGKKTIWAHFTPHHYKISTKISTATPDDSGVVRLFPKKDYYKWGDEVLVRAVPNPGYRFTKWSGDASGSQTPVRIRVVDNMFITVEFTAGEEFSGVVEDFNAYPFIRESFFADPGWQVFNGTWTVSNGQYIQTEAGGESQAISDFEITNGQISFEAVPKDKDSPGFGIYVKYIDNSNYFYVLMGAGGKITTAAKVKEKDDDKETGISFQWEKTFEPKAEYNVRIIIDKDQMGLNINDTDYGRKAVPLKDRVGRVGFYTENPTTYANLVIYPQCSYGPGWMVKGGIWRVVNGQYHQTETQGGFQKSISPHWITNGTIVFDAATTAKAEYYEWSCFGFYAKYIDDYHFIYVCIGAYRAIRVFTGNGCEHPKYITLKSFTPEIGTFYRVEATIDGNILYLKIDGEDKGNAGILYAGEAGKVGFHTENPALFDNLKIIRNLPQPKNILQ